MENEWDKSEILSDTQGWRKVSFFISFQVLI